MERSIGGHSRLGKARTEREGITYPWLRLGNATEDLYERVVECDASTQDQDRMHENALGKRPANKVVRVGRIVQNYLRAATAVKIGQTTDAETWRRLDRRPAGTSGLMRSLR